MRPSELLVALVRGLPFVVPHTEMKKGDTVLVRVETAVSGENVLEAALHDARIVTKSKEMRQRRPNARCPQRKCWPCAFSSSWDMVLWLGQCLARAWAGQNKGYNTPVEGNLLRYAQLNSIPLVRSTYSRAPYLCRHATLPSCPWSSWRRWCCHLSLTGTKWCSCGTRASR